MNEKLKEIAVQAQVEHCISHVRLQEFAELIIKETLQVARAGIEFGDGMEDAVYRYFEIGISTEDKKTLIKKLLGVKK